MRTPSRRAPRPPSPHADRVADPVALPEDLQDSLPPQDDVAVQKVLFDAEDQVLFSQAREVGNVEFFRQVMKVGDALAF